MATSGRIRSYTARSGYMIALKDMKLQSAMADAMNMSIESERFPNWGGRTLGEIHALALGMVNDWLCKDHDLVYQEIDG